MKVLKKRRYSLVLLFAVTVLALGLTGGVIWAQEGNTPDEGARHSMASRVAAILGLGEAEVEAAFQQAGREMQEDKFDMRMDRLVEKGQITEDEAVEAVDWYKARPENIGPGHRGSRFKRRGHQRPGASFGFSGMRGADRFAPRGS